MPVASVRLEGGLGNILFQLSFIYCYARKHNVLFNIRNPNHRSPHSNQSYESIILRFQSEPNYSGTFSENHSTITESTLDEFQCVQWPTIEKDTYFVGYFQNIGYYKDDIPALRRLILGENFHVDANPKWMFIHFRFGDYIGHSRLFLGWEFYHDFYKKQLQRVSPEIERIHVLSDNIQETTKMYDDLLQTDTRIAVVDLPHEWDAFMLMMRCGGGAIVSNSSFPFWPLILNKAPMILAPTKWCTDIHETEFRHPYKTASNNK